MLIPLGHDILRLLLLLLRATTKKNQRSIFVNFQDRGKGGTGNGPLQRSYRTKNMLTNFLFFFFLLFFRIFNGSLARAVQFFGEEEEGE